ncbi:MAG: hypothetical protein PHT40_01095 [Patescibacteria group bacterium]|nr:hypothetical protein [Patescibacteria group bacterium]
MEKTDAAILLGILRAMEIPEDENTIYLIYPQPKPVDLAEIKNVPPSPPGAFGRKDQFKGLVKGKISRKGQR